MTVLTATERDAIRAARDNALRAEFARKRGRVTSGAPVTLHEVCYEAARGDPLLALDLAVSAHQTIRAAGTD